MNGKSFLIIKSTRFLFALSAVLLITIASAEANRIVGRNYAEFPVYGADINGNMVLNPSGNTSTSDVRYRTKSIFFVRTGFGFVRVVARTTNESCKRQVFRDSLIGNSYPVVYDTSGGIMDLPVTRDRIVISRRKGIDDAIMRFLAFVILLSE